MQIEEVKPLLAHHVEGARLFANRYEQMVFIQQQMAAAGITEPNVLEIGVGFGWFSKFLIKAFSPRQFAAVDLFEFHKLDDMWGVKPEDLFKGRTHIEYFRDEITAEYDGDLVIEEGYSDAATARLPDAHFDVIYIDAGHFYEDVIKDIRISLQKIKRGGYIVLNDYTMMDHIWKAAYGVVKAANEVITERDNLKVIGLALDAQMFCDLAVRVD